MSKDVKEISYEESGLDERIVRAVKEMGFENMTPIQAQAIPVFLNGKDIIGQARTGTGKTAAFGIPILQMTEPEDKNLQALILCPTRELAIQAAEEIRKFGKYFEGIKVLPIYGGQDISKQIRSLKGGVQIVVGTPGRVMDHMRRHTLKLDNLKMIVLDEADEMLNMGFREDIETILSDIPKEHQTGLFSATMPKAILNITRTYQKPDAVLVKVSVGDLTVPLVRQYYYEVKQKNKDEVTARLLDYYNPKRSLIFCNTKRKVDELAEVLKGRGYFAEGLHGDMKQAQRDRVMKAFRSGRVEILIATDVAARGIDIKDIDVVFNYDLPDDMEYYVHRIGRTGRANREGVSYSLVSRREMYRLHEIMRYTKAKIKLMTIPNVAEITNVRIQQTLNGILDVLSHQKLDTYEQAILDFVENTDDAYTILNVAAAFLARDSDTGELKEIEENFSSDRRRGNSRSGNPNATRMFINVGRLDRVNVNTMRKLLNDANITDEEIYDIDIMEKFSFIEINNSKVDDVFVALNGIMMNGRRVNTEISNTKKRNNNSRSNGRDGRRSSEGRDNRRSSGGNSNRDSSRRRYED